VCTGPRLTVCVRPRLISSTNDWPKPTVRVVSCSTDIECLLLDSHRSSINRSRIYSERKKVWAGFYKRNVLLHRCKKRFQLGLKKKEPGGGGGTRILRLVPGERSNDDRSSLLRRRSVSLPPAPSMQLGLGHFPHRASSSSSSNLLGIKMRPALPTASIPNQHTQIKAISLSLSS
jgi:hypothetical protein